MKRCLLLISVNDRISSALEVQKILTKYGDIVLVRLGLHNSSENKAGLIILELKPEKEKIDMLQSELKNIPEVNLKYVEI